MKRNLLAFSIIALLMVPCGLVAKQPHRTFPEKTSPYSAAHRGCHIDGFIPENSPAGVAMAARYGFRTIECDVHYTADRKMILMHDGSINRTMRNASDYSKLDSIVHYKDLTLDQLRKGYVLASDDPALRTPIPTFEEELAACKEYGIVPMLHTDLKEAYQAAYDVLGDGFIAFDVSYEALKEARKISSCLILWDPGKTPAEEVVEKLKALGGRCGVSTMNDKMLDAAYIKTIKDAGFEVQSSIFPCPKELKCIADGATIVLSDFSLFHHPGGPGKIAASSKSGALKMQAGQTYSFETDHIECASIEVRIRCKGSVEMKVDDKYTYQLKSDSTITRIGGWRSYKVGPSVKVTALEDSEVRVETVVYSY